MKKIASVVQADEPPLEIVPAALQLDGYYVKELHCAVRADSDLKAKFLMGTGYHVQQSGIMACSQVSTNLIVEFGQNAKDESKFRVLLQVQSDDEKDELPYTFDIKLVGFFSITDVQPFVGMDVFVSRNAVMLLYSTAREVIAATTGRGPFPALILPTLTFDIKESVRAAIREKAEEEIKSLAKKSQRQLAASTKKASKKRTSKKK